jgi:hypothetical protein
LSTIQHHSLSGKKQLCTCPAWRNVVAIILSRSLPVGGCILLIADLGGR